MTPWEVNTRKDFNEARDDRVSVTLVGTYRNYLHLAADR